ncbi:MAG TPA: quinone-dependent dihydroorotate dehydrogenase [Pyrinomonadaceae bacterium]|jgi:dihydroorotate dehydrogenase
MAKLFEKAIRPMLFRVDAERAHELGIKALRLGLVPRPRIGDDVLARIREICGPIRRFGLEFSNPLGIAAGFDKNAIIVNQLAALGFGHVEIGTVTSEPQPGNEKPRLFRLPDDRALINRLGFNNDGAIKIAARLAGLNRRCVVGVNIGRNKDVANEDAVENYLKTFELVHGGADYIAVNVSSPNTPNLRDLQSAENLNLLLTSIQMKNNELGAKPLLVKIAPDLTDGEIESIAELCLRVGVSGIIATNTTVSRDALKTRDIDRFGAGGLSGRPLAERSNKVISQIYKYSKGTLPIIGVGGIFSPDDAFNKIAAGASLLQAYTGFVYGGPTFATRVVSGLAEILKKRGFASLDEAVGSAVT